MPIMKLHYSTNNTNSPVGSQLSQRNFDKIGKLWQVNEVKQGKSFFGEDRMVAAGFSLRLLPQVKTCGYLYKI